MFRSTSGHRSERVMGIVGACGCVGVSALDERRRERVTAAAAAAAAATAAAAAFAVPVQGLGFRFRFRLANLLLFNSFKSLLFDVVCGLTFAFCDFLHQTKQP